MRWAMLGATIGALALGGMAWANIPNGNGTIDGCFSTADGSLRVIDTSTGQSCNTKKERPLSWNQTGQQGPAGATGPTGPAGPSDAWDTKSGLLDEVVIHPFETSTVASLSLPAGDFFVAAKTSIVGLGGYTCDLSSGSATLDTSSGSANAVVTIPVQSTVHLPSGGTVSMDCSQNSVSDGFAFQMHIDAIQVGALH